MDLIDIKSTNLIYLDVYIRKNGKHPRRTIVNQYPLELSDKDLDENCKLIMMKLREMQVLPPERAKYTFVFKHVPHGSSSGQSKPFNNKLSLRANRVNRGDTLQLTIYEIKLMEKPFSEDEVNKKASQNSPETTGKAGSNVSVCGDQKRPQFFQVLGKSYIEVLLKGTPTRAYICTGLTENVLYESYLRNIDATERLEKLNDTDPTRVESGQFIGKTRKVICHFGNDVPKKLKLDFVVHEGKGNHILLGLNFLKQTHAKIDIGAGSVELRNFDPMDGEDALGYVGHSILQDDASSTTILPLIHNHSSYDLVPGTNDEEIKIAMITENGFSTELAQKALIETNNNVDEALAFCFQSME